MASIKRTLQDGTVSISQATILNYQTQLIAPLLTWHSLPHLGKHNLRDNGKEISFSELIRQRGDRLGGTWDEEEVPITTPVLMLLNTELRLPGLLHQDESEPLFRLAPELANGGWMYDIGLNREAEWIVVQVTYQTNKPAYSFGSITSFAVGKVSLQTLLTKMQISPRRLAESLLLQITRWEERARERSEAINEVAVTFRCQKDLFF